METPGNLDTKVGKLYQRDRILVFFLKQVKDLEQNVHHQANHSRVWEHQKQNCDQSVFLFVYRWVELRNLQEPLIWAVVSCAIPSAKNRQMRAEKVWVTTVKKLIIQSGCFENTPKFNWQPMEFFLKIGLAHEYLYISYLYGL